MHVLLSSYTLAWTNRKDIVPGMRVCPANGTTKVGIITHVGKKRDTCYGGPLEVTVLWTTGKQKGKSSVHPSRNLACFDAYTDKIVEEAARLEAMVEESKQFGM